MKRGAAPLRALLLAISVAGSAAAGTGWRAGLSKPVVRADVENLIQQEHARVCAGDSLPADKQLRSVARWKAATMGLLNDFSHHVPEDQNVFSYFGRAGITWANGAEIIAVNNFPDDTTAQAAFDGWMASDNHRPAIQACAYDRLGVGVFKTSDGKKWYVALFTE